MHLDSIFEASVISLLLSGKTGLPGRSKRWTNNGQEHYWSVWSMGFTRRLWSERRLMCTVHLLKLIVRHINGRQMGRFCSVIGISYD